MCRVSSGATTDGHWYCHVPQINTFYYQRESALKVRLRTLIDKRKLLTASLSDASGKVKALSRDSSSYGALYEGFRNFERDLGRLQVRHSLSLELASLAPISRWAVSFPSSPHFRPTLSSTRQRSARSVKSGTRHVVDKQTALVISDVSRPLALDNHFAAGPDLRCETHSRTRGT